MKHIIEIQEYRMPTSNSNISWIYGISIILATLGGIGSVFLANKIYPMTGGEEIVTPTETQPEPEPEPEPEIEAPPQQEMDGGNSFPEPLNTTWKTPNTNGLNYQF